MATATKRPVPAPVLLNETEAAKYLTVSVGSLRAWRGQGSGPRFLKVGVQVRYRPSDLDDYLDGSVVEPTE
ncbi:helix-turn-helix domain-containing protein [Leucobacter chromiireducens]|uniref:helix-turn-helix domain-containing protein n=1 Tax=Leucobacter chromiireducens TaxID=283877 RepID=UPI000F64113F|nr:helix-turn-helix domain-containing protein [Leucobacter chromiireducens]